MSHLTPARRRALCLAAFPALLAAGAVAVPTSVRPASVQDVIQTVAVGGQVHALLGSGGNVGVMLGSDGVLMVDDKFERNAAAIQDAIRALGGERPVWLLNTHWHGDHTGGNAHFGAAATIVSHANVRRRLAGDPEIGGRVASEEPAPTALPVMTYDGSLSLHFNGEEVRVLHLGPGHTDGDSVVWFVGSNVVHTGDLFFEIGYPFVDLDSGGDVEGVLASCRRVLELVPADVAIIPGHGRPTDVAGLRDYVAMVETCLERVRAARSEGKSVEDMLAEGLLGDLNERWGSFDFVTPERWLRTLAAQVDRQ
jgi:glyoxylase-like metal-dependent hydrolase (beta-lactamase superfamily II)